MKRTPSNPSEAAELRRRAEARFSEKQKSQRPVAGTERTADDTQRHVQELQIHQFELEIQNEQLEQARAETQEALELYTDLYDFAPSGYFTLDRDGTIRQVNLTGSELLRVNRLRLVNRRFGLFVAENSRLAFQVFAEKVFASQSRETCEAMLLREDNPPFYARIEARSSDNGQECRAVVADITERKEAEEEIRRLAAKLEQQNAELSARNQELFRSEQKLLLQSTALETAANAVVITDTEGIILWVNPAFVALTGYTSEEAVGKTPRLLKSGQHDLEFYKALWTTLLAGRTWRGSFTNRRKDGRFYHGEHTITPVRSKDGKITHFIAIMNDVTDRRQAEEALREREVELREAQRLTKVGNWKLIGETVTWSEELHRIFGHDPALPAPSYSEQKEIIAPESWARLQVIVERATKTGTPYELDLEIVCPDGGHKWITARGEPIRDEDGRITGLRGTAQDITERLGAEEGLRQSEMRLAGIIGSAMDGIISADEQQRIMVFNAAAEKMFGYTASEMLGQSLDRLIPERFRAAHAGDIRKYGQTQVMRRTVEALGTIFGLRASGEEFPIEASISQTTADGAKLFTVILRDVTERRLAEQLRTENSRLEERSRQVEMANRLKSEFLANMSHELRTPLNAIIGFTQMLIDRRPGPLNPKQAEYLDDVYNSAAHLLALVNDVLDMAKLEAGKMELSLETFVLEKVVGEVCAVLQGIANKKEVKLTWAVAPEFDRVTLDRQKFKQICYNLLSNAVKFTNLGGNVEIRAVRREDDWLELKVMDTGIGIEPEDLSRLFREFVQIDSGASRHYEGTGLGLALTRKLVELQGGRIGVESEVGKGSCFTVMLPLVMAEVNV